MDGNLHEPLKDKRIAVVMGGNSAEREVSLKSGRAMFESLKSGGYKVLSIDICNDICEEIKKENVDVVVLALHGGHGEDGSIQGLLEILGIPYTGSGVLASSICMDKVMSKVVFSGYGLNVAPYVSVETGDLLSVGYNKVPFQKPWIVKPYREGSSVGINIVKNNDEFRSALDEAFSYGKKAIVEQFISGREIHVGVLAGNVIGMVEVRTKKDFYDYDAKYMDGTTEYIVSPELDENVFRNLNEAALGAYDACGCSGAARVDFIVDSVASKIYILEINTLPGMTETSLIPKIAKASGYTFLSLIEQMIVDAFSGKKN